MRMVPLVLVTLAIFGVMVTSSVNITGPKPPSPSELKQQFGGKHVRSVDHAKLAALQKDFRSGRDVTEACLSCHTERHTEVMRSSHWNWSRMEFIPGRGIRAIGKKNVLNNFCIGVSDNQEGCSRCHAGYGMDDAAFDFKDPRNIDCLVCHDGSDTYAKGLAGMPLENLNLREIVQKVGPPKRTNCGGCHFYGGGGNNVKHGDLEQALLTGNRELDVHMAADGGDLECTACHRTKNHQMLGKLYSVSSMNRNRSTCEQCHTATPHASGVLNNHGLKVACQTCHIPLYAKASETKVAWDWSTAGKLRNGEPYEDENAAGNPVYASIKGDFTWATNLKPDYVFFNGTAGHYLLGDKVPPQRPLEVNTLNGSYDDPDARITPVKIHRGKQIYDPETNLMIQPKLFAKTTGEGGFWKDFNWQRAAEEGMKTAGLPYSGKYEFIDTVMYWPVNHMVAPKEKALQCVECHTPANSRMAGLKGFYMPGRDRNPFVESAGGLAIGLTALGVLLHGLLRAVHAFRRRTVS
ncbi:MAG: tetrathionate reductase family octaheme c-type cytochrome [Bryobacteraceae bacterium]